MVTAEQGRPSIIPVSEITRAREEAGLKPSGLPRQDIEVKIDGIRNYLREHRAPKPITEPKS